MMNTPSADAAPESNNAPFQGSPSEVQAYGVASNLLTITEAVLAQGGDPDFPALSQLILQRNLLIDEIARLPIAGFSTDARRQIIERLQQASALDEAVQASLHAVETQLKRALSGVSSDRRLANKYTTSNEASEVSTTRSRDA